MWLPPNQHVDYYHHDSDFMDLRDYHGRFRMGQARSQRATYLLFKYCNVLRCSHSMKSFRTGWAAVFSRQHIPGTFSLAFSKALDIGGSFVYYLAKLGTPPSNTKRLMVVENTLSMTRTHSLSEPSAFDTSHLFGGRRRFFRKPVNNLQSLLACWYCY